MIIAIGQAARELILINDEIKNQALGYMAAMIRRHEIEIQDANQKDVAQYMIYAKLWRIR
jgi:gamma-glutamyl phosphate reductase